MTTKKAKEGDYSSNKIRSLLRDVSIFAVLVYVIIQWQERNLLDDDGSVVVENQTLVSLHGSTTTLFPLSPENEKNTLIYFFAPWCNVCAYSIGNLSGLNEENVNVVRIALDYTSATEVQKFITENNVAGEILLGNDDLKSKFNIPGYPTYYMIDQNQTIVASSMGYSSTLGLKMTEFFSNN